MAAGPAGHFDLPALLSRPFPAVMGVLNVTPDSFSDGGRFLAPETALAQARRMVAEGADIIDIGAESTRPYGSEPISADDELARLRQVLPDVVSLGVPVSIDSMKAAVVAWALDHGAVIDGEADVVRPCSPHRRPNVRSLFESLEADPPDVLARSRHSRP